MTPIHNYNGSSSHTMCINCGVLAKVGMTADVFCDDCLELDYKEVNGDLITGTETGYFDVIAHDCNCFSNYITEFSLRMVDVFECDLFNMEMLALRGNRTKLGNIDCESTHIPVGECGFTEITIINMYTHYETGSDLSYKALINCLKQLNSTFAGKQIGMPQIGCTEKKSKWSAVKYLIKRYLKDCKVTIVIKK